MNIEYIAQPSPPSVPTPKPKSPGPYGFPDEGQHIGEYYAELMKLVSAEKKLKIPLETIRSICDGLLKDS